MQVDAAFPLLALSCLVSAGVTVVAWRRRAATPAAYSLAAVMGFIAVWSAAAALGHSSLDLAVQRLLLVVTYGATAGVVASLFCLARSLHDHDWRLHRRTGVLLAVMPIATTLAVLTNPWHESFFSAVFLGGVPPTVRFQYAPLFWCHTIYSYVLLAVSIGILVRSAVRASGAFRRQIVSIIAASMIPIVGAVWTTMQGADGSPQIPITPVFFTLTGVIAAFAVLRQGLLQLVPIARSRVVETIGDAVLVVDLQHRVLDVNAAAKALLERLRPGLPDDLVGLPVEDVAPQGVAEAIEEGEYHHLVEPMPGLYLDVRISQVRDRSGRLLGNVVLGHDVSRMHIQGLALSKANDLMREQLATIEALRAELVEEAIRDSLTGLYNRRHLMRALDGAVDVARESGTPVSLLMIDIDHFKRVNDGFGHLVGDDVLKAVARCLLSVARVGDTVARLGGEEFVFVLPGAGVVEASCQAESVRESCAELSLRPVGADLSITVSVGVATLPTNASSGDELIGQADLAMYAAKLAGRNQVLPAPMSA